MMLGRIKIKSSIKNSKIKKISDKKYRVYLGPFNNINSLQKSYNDISILQFKILKSKKLLTKNIEFIWALLATLILYKNHIMI